MNKKNRKTNGFTLVEVMVATFILITAFGAILGLSISSIRVNRFTRNELIANTLAQEGLEMVRFLRDNRWLACPQGSSENCWKQITATDTEPTETTIYRVGEDFFNQTGIILESVVDRDDDTKLFICETPYGSAYVHEYVSCTNPEKTPFRREITFGGRTVPPLGDQDIPVEHYLVVRSRVTWSDDGKLREYILEEVLYWKPV